MIKRSSYGDNMEFVNLYNQTEYSMLTSSLKINELIKVSKEMHYNALAITDLNNVHGVIKFYSKCKDAQIKPIIGLTVSIKGIYENNYLLLYAKTLYGYNNLLKIATLVKAEGAIEIINLSEYLSDIIVILPGNENEIIKGYIDNHNDLLKALKQYKKYLGDFYMGLDFQSIDMVESFSDLLSFAASYNIRCVALNKTSFLNKDDFEVYEVLRCVDANIKKYVASEKEHNSYLISMNNALDKFRNYPELINNTKIICDACNVEIEFGKYKMPVYDATIDTNNYLHDLAYVGLKKRLSNSSIEKNDYEKYITRIDYELDIISKMGFSDYFLIVYDFIKYAKRKKILVGPGRGSAPGSLVAYSLGITELDPLKYNLLFERFLNPERISMPDIDTDFPDDAREDVICYMGRKYGKNRVAHISTFGTYGPRLAVRDIARVKELDSMYVDEILKYIDNSIDSISDVIEKNEIFKRMTIENDVIKDVVRLVKKMENLPRNLSIHAAGIIMADTDLVDYTGLLEGINGLYQTQYEAPDLEKLGLVKIDFLGLRNLTIIDKIIKLIPQNFNFNLYKIPLDDKATYQMLASGDTDGVFQLESTGMRKTIMQLKTSSFEDIVNALALYRPGPMEMIPLFCKRKFGVEKIVYLHNDLKDILESTYGTIVYQEQILLIASKFAGFSLGEADILRRAVSKKKVDVLMAIHDKFVSGAIKLGYESKIAEEIFEYILKFANYGFNKSHSAAYSLISYQMAYLKKHFFKEFMTVIMSYNIGKIPLIKSYIMECTKANINILLPSINHSSNEFVLEGNNIYYSLLGINGLGEVIINNIVIERNTNGLYKSYDDFIARTKEVLSRKVVETLIYAGALDEFKIPRKEMILEYDKSIQLANYGGMFKENLSTHEFGDDEFSFEDISNYERLALGFNLKFDIFKRYINVRKKYNAMYIGSLAINSTCNLMFVIDRIHMIKTKKGDEMAFAALTDETGSIDGVLFPKVYELYKDNLVEGKIYLAEVRVELRQEKMQAVINKVFVKQQKKN